MYQVDTQKEKLIYQIVRKKQQKRRDNTFFRTMKLHIKFIQSIIYSLHIVITHHPVQH